MIDWLRWLWGLPEAYGLLQDKHLALLDRYGDLQDRHLALQDRHLALQGQYEASLVEQMRLLTERQAAATFLDQMRSDLTVPGSDRKP